MKNNNLWILTEERPKREVIANILMMFAKDNKFACFIDTIRILPILEKENLLFYTKWLVFVAIKLKEYL